jgi:hypothetical protein
VKAVDCKGDPEHNNATTKPGNSSQWGRGAVHNTNCNTTACKNPMSSQKPLRLRCQKLNKDRLKFSEAKKVGRLTIRFLELTSKYRICGAL